MNQDIRHAFVLSFVAASLDALKRDEVAVKKKRTAYVLRLESLEESVNKALEKLPRTMQPAHAVSAKAEQFFEESQAILDRILGGAENG